MLLGVLSDTHLSRPDKLEALLKGPLAEAQALIHAGDHTGQAVEDYLEYVEPRPYYGVAGNCDMGRAGCALPAKRTIELAGLRVGVTHGVFVREGMEERLLSEFDGDPLDLLIFGHTHKPLIKRVGKTLIVNPGSPFEPRWRGPGTVALVTLEGAAISARHIELR